MLEKRTAVKKILEGVSAERIPVIMNAFSLPVMRYGYTMGEVRSSPEKMVECMTGTRRALGYDGLCAGAYGGIEAMMGGHLMNADGKISGGTDTTSSILPRIFRGSNLLTSRDVP